MCLVFMINLGEVEFFNAISLKSYCPFLKLEKANCHSKKNIQITKRVFYKLCVFVKTQKIYVEKKLITYKLTRNTVRNACNCNV